jgi:EAL domain-containing protein (putative c-di-GMP-specific phosphodiesterase class I)
MSRATEQGRDRTSRFAPEINTQMRTRLATAGGLRAAVANDQLRVHYQPIVDLESGRTIAVEALVRWQHPTRGLLMPGDFIGLAEETGQIGEIDRAVLVTACREFGLLAAEHPTLSLNVNLSLQHLSRSLLRDALVRGLAEGGLSPAQLTVEVTESADLSGEEFAQLLATVKELGIKVAIDDFGTGFSALSRLNGLGVDRIKVDRSFVRHVHEEERSQLLVAAMTQLAGALDAVVVAEGIEEAQQAVVLQRLGCVGGQGYLWSKPVELDELATWITRRSRSIRVPAPRGEIQEPSTSNL